MSQPSFLPNPFGTGRMSGAHPQRHACNDGRADPHVWMGSLRTERLRWVANVSPTQGLLQGVGTAVLAPAVAGNRCLSSVLARTDISCWVVKRGLALAALCRGCRVVPQHRWHAALRIAELLGKDSKPWTSNVSTTWRKPSRHKVRGGRSCGGWPLVLLLPWLAVSCKVRRLPRAGASASL